MPAINDILGKRDQIVSMASHYRIIGLSTELIVQCLFIFGAWAVS